MLEMPRNSLAGTSWAMCKPMFFRHFSRFSFYGADWPCILAALPLAGATRS
jgi:hypothetical protein